MAGRKKLPPAPEQKQGDDDLIQEDLAKADKLHHQLMVIDEKFGDGQLYAKERVIAEAKFYINQGAEAFIQAGRRLVLIKEHEGHGGFGAALEELSLGWRTANNMMKIAAKFSNSQTFANLGSSKLIELAVLDDDEIEELEKGGTVAGIEFDDLDKMSVRELKAALKEAREDKEATQRVLDDKNTKIDKLSKQLKKLPDVREWPEECSGLVEAIQGNVLEALKPLSALSQHIDALIALMAEREASDDAARITAIQVTSELHTLVNALAPIQQATYDGFAAQLGSTYTSLLKPGQGE